LVLQVTDLPFFATTVKLGKKGVEEIIGEDLDSLTEYEKKAVDALKSELQGSIEKGVQFAKKQAATV
jgi:malate dehydrogenase